MNKERITLISKILTVISAVLCALIFTMGNILTENATAVSGFLNSRTQIIYEDENEEEQDTQYWKSQFSSVKEVKANGEALCEEVVSEGTVLLKNDGALPIEKGSKINLYSASSVNVAISGGGSSATTAGSVDFKTALEDPSVNLDVNDTLYQWYINNLNTYGRKAGTGIGARNTIQEAPWSVLPSAKSDEAQIGLFVLTRVGSEDADVWLNNGDTADYTNGNYITLSPAEKTVLAGMKVEKDAGHLKKIVILMNTTNQVETHFVDDPAYGIDAVLWCGTVGSTGIRAVADILVGNVNPSGRLSDTFWENHRYNPSLANFGDYNYQGKLKNGDAASLLAIYDYGTTYRAGYVVYQEGIYVGYRYTETRYEDTVLGRENVGDYNYSDVVTYPFGYGLSYTEFRYDDFSVTYDKDSDSYNVSVKVTNTGGTAGKEVVQIYLQKPYTEYDVENGVEKASVELVGFAKTDILESGASQTVNITVDRELFASYDSYGAKTYILDGGDYFLTVAKDAHDAVNNIISHKKSNGATVNDAKIVKVGDRGEGDAGFVYKETLTFGLEEVDSVTYSVTDDPVKSGYKSEPSEITNKFDYADLNINEGRGDNSVTYVSRNDWNGTVKYGIGDDNVKLNNQTLITINESLEAQVREEIYQNPAEDDITYPAYGSTITSFSLIDMRVGADGERLPYDDSRWDDLLNQLTWDETVALLQCGERMTSAIARIGKLQTIDHNGAVGVNQSYAGNEGVNRGFAVMTKDPDRYTVPPAYPSNALAASTFNDELMLRYGEAWGEDCLWAGYAGLYGPGLNTHRNPYGGRNFEYYSEDSFLSGRICAKVSAGIESKGVYVYLKHAVLNDQEEGRRTISTWANEQTIREIYLRPFEMAIEEGGAENVMLGLNKIGPTSCVLSGFTNDVLREEFGMRGFAVTDYQHNAQSQIMPVSHIGGTDLPDRNYSFMGAYDRFKTGHGEIAWAMRESVHRILYTVVHSAAMNGISSSTKMLILTPDWTFWLTFAESTSLALVIVSAVLLICCYAFPVVPEAVMRLIRKKNKATEQAECSADSATAVKITKRESFRAYMRRKEPLYVWIIRGVAVGALCVCIIVNSVGLSVQLGDNRKLIETYGATSSARVNETAGGEGVKANRFEAELTEFKGQSYTALGTPVGYASVPVSYAVSEEFGGGICLTGIGTERTDETAENTDKLTFRFTSDKKVRVTMVCRVSGSRYDSEHFADYCDLTVNGKTPGGFADIGLPRDLTGDAVPGNEHVFYMVNVETYINLNVGENIVEFTMKKSIDFDYIDINTSAVLTDYVENYWWGEDSTGVTVIKSPTLNDSGTIVFADENYTSTYMLPALLEGLGCGIYRRADDENSNTAVLYFGSSNVLLQTISIAPHTLTLSGDATFGDGNSVTVRASDNIPKAEVNLPEGGELLGWYDVDDPSVYWNRETFPMPDRDLTIAPVIEDNDYVTTPGEEWKRVCLLPEQFTSVSPIRTDKGNGFEMTALRDSMTKEILSRNGEVQVSTVYNYASGVCNDWSFLTMNECNINFSGDKTIWYTIENKGTETVSFNLYQTNSSANPVDAPNKSVTLAPGEQTELYFVVNYLNGNLLSYFEFTRDTSGALKLAVVEKITTGDKNPDKPPVTQHTVTISGDATFADGGKTAVLNAGSVLPDVKLTGNNVADDKVLTGWIVDDGTSKTYASADSFKIPDKDVTITPYVCVKFDNVKTNGEGTLDFSEQGSVDNFIFSFISNTTVSKANISSQYKVTDGKVGTEYTFAGQTGQYFRIVRAYKIDSSRLRTITYKLVNNGSETLTFTMHQVNSGVDISKAPSSGTVTLSPGESTTVTLNAQSTDGTNYSNSNLMCLFTLGADVTDARLWISATVTLPTESQEPVTTSTTNYSAILNGGITAADGSKSVNLYACAALPSVTLTPPATIKPVSSGSNGAGTFGTLKSSCTGTLSTSFR